MDKCALARFFTNDINDFVKENVQIDRNKNYLLLYDKDNNYYELEFENRRCLDELYNLIMKGNTSGREMCLGSLPYSYRIVRSNLPLHDVYVSDSS